MKLNQITITERTVWVSLLSHLRKNSKFKIINKMLKGISWTKMCTLNVLRRNINIEANKNKNREHVFKWHQLWRLEKGKAPAIHSWISIVFCPLQQNDENIRRYVRLIAPERNTDAVYSHSKIDKVFVWVSWNSAQCVLVMFTSSSNSF